MNINQPKTKAFICFTKDLWGSDDYDFVVGENYEINVSNNIHPYDLGFHICLTLFDCIRYRTNNIDNKFFELTIFGEYTTDCNIIYPQRIRVDKEVDPISPSHRFRSIIDSQEVKINKQTSYECCISKCPINYSDEYFQCTRNPEHVYSRDVFDKWQQLKKNYMYCELCRRKCMSHILYINNNSAF